MSIVDQSTAVTATSLGVSITAPGSTHTKGSWVELIASTSEETYWMQVAFSGTTTIFDTQFMIDIGIGAAASETVVISNIPVFTNLSGVIYIPPMPRTIPSGSRVSVRCQSSIINASVQCMIFLSNDDDFGTSTSNETIGSDVSTSRGTTIDPGATINTKGSYSELVASSSIDANYIVVMLSNNNNAFQTTMSRLYDIATGASSSEVNMVSDDLFFSVGSEDQSLSTAFFQSISSGSRVSVRGQATNSNSVDRVFDVSILLFNIVAPAGGGGGIAQIVGQGGIVG